jgi:hypothetical protein
MSRPFSLHSAITTKEKPMSIRSALLFVLSVVLSCSFADAVRAQESPSAPMPSQLSSAKKVFISNGGGDINPYVASNGQFPGLPVRPYNDFYAALKSWGRYELVGAPADADLIFEISFSESFLGGTIQSRLRLLVLDPKTHVVLWPFAEYIEAAAKAANREKNFEQGMAQIVADAKSLVVAYVAPAKN